MELMYKDIAENVFGECPEDKLRGRWSRLGIQIQCNHIEVVQGVIKVLMNLMFEFKYPADKNLRHYRMKPEYLLYLLKKKETDSQWQEWYTVTDDISNQIQTRSTPFLIMSDDYDWLACALYTSCADLAINPEEYYIVHEEGDVYEIHHIED